MQYINNNRLTNWGESAPSGSGPSSRLVHSSSGVHLRRESTWVVPSGANLEWTSDPERDPLTLHSSLFWRSGPLTKLLDAEFVSIYVPPGQKTTRHHNNKSPVDAPPSQKRTRPFPASDIYIYKIIYTYIQSDHIKCSQIIGNWFL